MIHFNKLKAGLFLVLTLFLLAGCKKDSSNPTSSTGSLTGTWVLQSLSAVTSSGTLNLTAAQAQVAITITINSNGTFSSTTTESGTTSNDTGTYTTTSNSITLTTGTGTTTTWTYSFSGSDLLIKATIPVDTYGNIPVTLDFKKQ